jgi:hypothetical protein
MSASADPQRAAKAGLVVEVGVANVRHGDARASQALLTNILIHSSMFNS